MNRSQDLVIGGYVPSPGSFDSILVGYYEGRDLRYAARVRNGFVADSRAKLFREFGGLEIERCPFQNLPEPKKGRWGEGLTAEDMVKCRWLKPRLVVTIEFVEWTPANHLRHCKFSAMRTGWNPRDVARESHS